MLVVARGIVIDWSEIYSAVADCEDQEVDLGGGRGVIIEGFTTGESQSGTSLVPGGLW